MVGVVVSTVDLVVASSVGVLATEDVSVEFRIVVGVHTLSNVGAELDEKDHAAAVRIDRFEFLSGLLWAKIQAERRHAGGELVHIDAPVL